MRLLESAGQLAFHVLTNSRRGGIHVGAGVPRTCGAEGHRAQHDRSWRACSVTTVRVPRLYKPYPPRADAFSDDPLLSARRPCRRAGESGGTMSLDQIAIELESIATRAPPGVRPARSTEYRVLSTHDFITRTHSPPPRRTRGCIVGYLALASRHGPRPVHRYERPVASSAIAPRCRRTTSASSCRRRSGSKATNTTGRFRCCTIRKRNASWCGGFWASSCARPLSMTTTRG